MELNSTRLTRLTVVSAVAFVTCAVALPAHAYIGPGAGFAVVSSFLGVFLAMATAFLSLLTWPLRRVIRAVRSRRALRQAWIKRAVVVGLDGMDPDLVDSFFARGMLPNLARLRNEGTYARLATTLPPLSPVAWSSFLTGTNPGKHNVFDFLQCDRRTYMPVLSSVHIGTPRKTLKLGRYEIPLSKPETRLLRKGTPFWNVLGDHGVFSSIIRVPITFPPEKTHGLVLSAMCVPDLRGSQGMFSFYTTADVETGEFTGGQRIRVRRDGNRINAELVGPDNTLVQNGGSVTVPFSVEVRADRDQALLRVGGRRVTLTRGVYTDWIRVTFRLAPSMKVSGLCQFLLIATDPEFELYVTPINIDPEKPAMPISHPSVFSVYLAKNQGPFATLGLAEDTWALNERILDDRAFIHQVTEADDERERMFFDSLKKVKRGLCVVVFDGTDRIQHMFWRYIDPKHPARDGFGENRQRDAIEAHYRRCDALVGKVMAECDDEDTALFVISDHGFKSFRRGVDLNRWLIDNGYMVLKADRTGGKYLADVDWSGTRAYALGLAGIFLNLKGREAHGTVEASGEADALRRELVAKLSGLEDSVTGDVAVTRAFNALTSYSGPYAEHAPDVIVGYNAGYRVSWEAAIGQITDEVFHDNNKAWSGDHCIDPRLVPGVMFSDLKIRSPRPRLLDIGPTILDMFGVDVPKHMDGRPLDVVHWEDAGELDAAAASLQPSEVEA